MLITGTITTIKLTSSEGKEMVLRSKRGWFQVVHISNSADPETKQVV